MKSVPSNHTKASPSLTAPFSLGSAFAKAFGIDNTTAKETDKPTKAPKKGGPTATRTNLKVDSEEYPTGPQP